MEFFFGPDGAVTTGFVEPGGVVLIDNCHTHKQMLLLLQEMLHRHGIALVLLPPYRSEYNPIELVWSKMKYLILRYGKATEDIYLQSLQRAAAEVSMVDMLGYYEHCGYI
jgi:transposase